MLPPHDVISGVVQALALLKNVMTEPWAKQLLGLPPSDVAKPEVPTPSEPPAIATPPVAVPAVPAETAPAVEAKNEVPSVSSPPEKLPEKPSNPKETGVVNSSTHRAAHARLVRKMDGLTETECPNMQKLWSGSRKDWLAINMLFKTYVCCDIMSSMDGVWYPYGLDPQLTVVQKSIEIPEKEKQALLQQWVASGENSEAIESTLKMSRSQTGELERGRECLTISEMKSKGFSK